MDLDKVLAELIRERDLLDEAIAHLERLSTGPQDVSSRPKRETNPDKPKERARGVGAASD